MERRSVTATSTLALTLTLSGGTFAEGKYEMGFKARPAIPSNNGRASAR